MKPALAPRPLNPCDLPRCGHWFRFLFFTLAFWTPLFSQTVIFDSADSVAKIGTQISQAEPATLFIFKPGVYSGTIEINGIHAENNPVTLRGQDFDAIKTEAPVQIDGGVRPTKERSTPAFRVRNSKGVVIQSFGIRNAWKDAVVIEDSSYITLRGCRIIGGQTAVLGQGDLTHHLLLEYCYFAQDPRIYTEWDWATMHHGDLMCYNGGFYGGTAAGGAVIRFNVIEDVFNGLRWWLGEDLAKLRRHQANIEIYENTFRRCRDNCVEPENFTWNLHVYHNRLDACPSGIFSIDSVIGGEIFLYGNTGTWSRAGSSATNSWAVYKFGSYPKKESLEAPLYIYHNSFAYHHVFPNNPKNVKANHNVYHFNNAYEFLPVELSKKKEDPYPFGVSAWPTTNCHFDYDLGSKPFDPAILKLGYEVHGLGETFPLFEDSANGSFALQAQSPAVDRANTLADFSLWYTGEAPDIGAYEQNQRQYGMPFVHHDPPGGNLYAERPRIVRIFSLNKTVLVFFSAPLREQPPVAVRLTQRGQEREIKGRLSHHFPQVLRLDLPSAYEAAQVAISFPIPPLGQNGERATLWAADLRNVIIPENAIPTPLLRKIME